MEKELPNSVATISRPATCLRYTQRFLPDANASIASPGVSRSQILTDFIASMIAGVRATFLFFTLFTVYPDLTVIVWVLVYSANPSMAFSTPMPDCLCPPKAICGPNT